MRPALFARCAVVWHVPRRRLSTALVRLPAEKSFFFERNGVLVGAALSSALHGAPPPQPANALAAAFLRACASAPTPLAAAPPPAAAAAAVGDDVAAVADYVFVVEEAAAAAAALRVRVYEGAPAPTFQGDAASFARHVAVGFGQC